MKTTESMKLTAGIDTLPNVSSFLREQKEAEKLMREASRDCKKIDSLHSLHLSRNYKHSIHI